MKALLTEFAPTFKFLGKFLFLYLLGNLCYGLFIESYGERPDPITFQVTQQAASILNYGGNDIEISENASAPTILLHSAGLTVLSVFEGCNGVNVMIVFVSFVFAFGPSSKRMLWFIPFGLVVIHLFNLGRIGLLYHVSKYQPDTFYFFHKYLFTSILYLAVIALWFLWVKKWKHAKPATQVVS